jgi:hypothetical protein
VIICIGGGWANEIPSMEKDSGRLRYPCVGRACRNIGQSEMKRSGASPHQIRVSIVTGFAAVRTVERAVCELCSGIIATTNGGLHTGLGFIPFERLLDLHMAERHPNVCAVPPAQEHQIAA